MHWGFAVCTHLMKFLLRFSCSNMYEETTEKHSFMSSKRATARVCLRHSHLITGKWRSERRRFPRRVTSLDWGWCFAANLRHKLSHSSKQCTHPLNYWMQWIGVSTTFPTWLWSVFHARCNLRLQHICVRNAFSSFSLLVKGILERCASFSTIRFE